MTLARKTMLRLGALTGALLAAGAAAIWGLTMLQHMAATTREEFEEFRSIHRVERHVWAASLEVVSKHRDDAVKELDQALDALESFEEFQESGVTELDESHASREQQLAQLTTKSLQAIRASLQSQDDADAFTPEQEKVIFAALQSLSELVDEFERVVSIVHDHTATRFRWVLIGLVALFVLFLATAVAIVFRHYQDVIEPLRYIRDGVRRVAGGELSTRLSLRGDAEFTELQTDFNRMAGELESLYRNLETRVAEQSRQLAVSERLASVGFLAAGVAHEINNPLAIMSGHAESLLRRLREAQSKNDDSGILRDLAIIRDEAFRAKKITQQLLDLSRNGDAHRGPVSVWRVIDDVTAFLKNARMCDGVMVRTSGETDDPLRVVASEPELRQVLLNLAVNAAHAVTAATGKIEIAAARNNGCVEIQVRDNGCGMSRETLQHVFEPFYTTRRGQAGVGLGLAISHAIVRRHNGELLPASDGPGHGSVFTLRLPAYKEPGA